MKTFKKIIKEVKLYSESKTRYTDNTDTITIKIVSKDLKKYTLKVYNNYTCVYTKRGNLEQIKKEYKRMG